MSFVCNIWMICLELNWFVYSSSWVLHFSEFVWTLCSSVLVVFNNFLFIDATDRSKISSDQKRLFYRIKPIYTSFQFLRTKMFSFPLSNLVKLQGNHSYYQTFSESVLQFIIIIYTNTNRNKKILYKSICMNKDYPGWRGSSGEPIIQGAGHQLTLFLCFPPPSPRS